MDKRFTFKAEGVEITGTREQLEELVSCISFGETKPSNALANIVSQVETDLELK